jgi:hypothetical protein
MNATHWGYEYLQEMVKQEQAYLEEMIGALAPESHMGWRSLRRRPGNRNGSTRGRNPARRSRSPGAGSGRS